MNSTYNSQVVKAFRDNAIRSVLLIDDEYMPYEKLIESRKIYSNKLYELQYVINQKNLKLIEEKSQELFDLDYDLKRCEVAQGFVEFFHNEKRICDVECNTSQLDFEKIRKSDLIVLDYFLEPEGTKNRSKASLDLVYELSKSKHMNTVVIYTNENLNQVWLEVCTTLRGTNTELFYSNHDEKNEKQIIWESNFDDWYLIFNNTIDDEKISLYLKNEYSHTQDYEFICSKCSEIDIDLPEEDDFYHLFEHRLSQLNKNNKIFKEINIHGEKGIWIQAGDVFVVLCSKNDQTTPQDVWNNIENALHNWNPGFYRVITSELQNKIEDANLSMDKVLSKGHEEQAAYLWGILRVSPDERSSASKEMLSNLLIDIIEKIQVDPEFINFIEVTANSFSEGLGEFTALKEDRNLFNAYVERSLSVAISNYKELSELDSSTIKKNIVHAFNEQLCTVKEDVTYISTGVVLKDTEISGDYYLCIAPGCNTIPNQLTGDIALQMTPHRPMRFIKLTSIDIKKAIKNAHQSDTIFISDENHRLALKVYEKDANSPTIVHGVVINHDDEPLRKNEEKNIQFFATDPDTKALVSLTKKFIAIAKLRAGFASRYQNIQLQYESRIGVDYVSATLI